MRFMKKEKDQEILWSRVLLDVVAVVILSLILGSLLMYGIGLAGKALQPPVPVRESTITIEEAVPEISRSALTTNLTTWPKEVLQKVPAGGVALPRETEAPLVLKSFDETKPGIRDIRQFFTFSRENVSGGKDLTIKTTVYGWRQFSQVKWYSDGLGQYQYQFAPKNEKYVFVFLAEFMDGNTTEKDPRAWYFGPDQFRLQVDGRLYDQDPNFVPAVRIYELEEIAGYNGIKGLRPYGYTIVQTRRTGNITAIEDPWLRMGISNAKDGYLVYRVPVNSVNMILVGSFGSWGTAAWRLV
jgi:hypothetical protein